MVSRITFVALLVCMAWGSAVEAAKLRRLESVTDAINQMLTAVNNERAKNGKSALCYNAKMIAASQAHSEDQATTGVMSHTGSGGSTLANRIDQQGFDWTAIAENVAAGQTTVQEVVQAWMNSDGHRRNILGDYHYLGVGYAYNSGTLYKSYWTIDFAASNSETCQGNSNGGQGVSDNQQHDLYTCEIVNGVDYVGNDIGTGKTTNPRDCFGICEAYTGCNAFTWTSYAGGTCWLKWGKSASQAGVTSNPGARSGTLCSSSCGRLEVGIDYVGNDIGSVSSISDPNGCYNICRSMKGCTAFSWNNYKSGTCWLKSAKGSTTGNGGVTSAKVCPTAP